MTPDSSKKRPRVLLVDDDQDFIRAVSLLLRDAFELHPLSDGRSALAEFESRAYDAVLLDIDLAKGPDGLEVLRRIRLVDPQVPVFMVTRMEQPNVAMKAGRLGATDYFTKGNPIDVLTRRICSALKNATAERQREALERGPNAERWQFVGMSEAVRQLLADAETVAEVDSPVMITGNNGTGKEVLARFIHRCSVRAEKPFVAVNCAAIPEGLFESELFGHERGAYTGATNVRRGSFELATGGTLLLDEITEMPTALQPKLLRALQSGEFSRVGSERVQMADARVICSSNRDLDKAVSSGQLRQDLYYRINVVRFHIPPLCERREDIHVLAHHFLRDKAMELGKHVEGITPEAEAILLAHNWPGNARELENLIERAVVFCRTSRIGPELMSPISEGAAFLTLPWEEARDLVMRRFERNYLTALLQVHRGSVSGAAQAMGVSRQALYKALERTGLDASAFRRPGSRRTGSDASVPH